MPVLPILDSKQFLFIIGAPRSGTTMLQILLGNHPSVATTVELTLFSRYLGHLLKTWDEEVVNLREKNWQQGLPFIFQEDEFFAILHGMLESTYGKVLGAKPDASHVLDKHPGYSHQVDAIKRMLPRARFLHIIRDGRDVALSMVSARKKMGFGAGSIPDAALAWKRFVASARQAAKYPDHYLEVRYEDLLERGVDAYAEVFDFCGLTTDRVWIEKTLAENTFEKMRDRRAAADNRTKLDAGHYRKGEAGVWRSELSPADCFEFDRLAGDLLVDLNYAQPGWWADSARTRIVEPVRHRIRQFTNSLRAATGRARSLVGGSQISTPGGTTE